MRREAVFLDRDGTLIEEVHYLSTIEQVRILPGAVEAVRAWNDAGVLVIVVTNQAGVARGYFPESRVHEVHNYLADQIAEYGAKIDAFYYCPHHSTEGVGLYRMACECRKPMPGLLHLAAREWDIDLVQSWMIGDKLSDVQAGAAAGCRTVLVRTGHGHTLPADLPATKCNLVDVVDDLAAAWGTWSALRDPAYSPNGKTRVS